MILVLSLLLAVAEPSPNEHDFTFAAVPTLTFNTDEGFGTGGVGTLYHRHAGVQPYRDAITINAFISSKLVQAHALTWDALKPFDIDGRMYLRAGYYSTVSQNYCGIGNEVTCAPGAATQAATRLGLDAPEFADARERFVRRYHLMRFIRPYATAIVRPWLRDKPYRTELLLGYRGAVVIPGELSVSAPYPASKFAEDFPDGQPGVSSVPFVGVIVDDRDAEAFPMRGFFFESSLRAGHALTGSTWEHAGVNASLASFHAMSRDPRVVLATRFMGDVIVGDPSIEEMARIGGTLDSIAFGGSTIGRGIREHRYIGKVKLIAQAELRAQLVKTELGSEVFDHGVALFGDAAMIGADVNAWGGNPAKVLGTIGISYRLLWNESFAIRWDLATSPNEPEGPGFYIIVGQAF